MKKAFMLLAILSLCYVLAFGQKKYEMVIEKTDGSEIAVNVENIKRIYFRESNTSYLTCPDGNHPHLIDLGLSSGTKWACCNVGASKPEGYGNYYAWGETQTKGVYNWSTYIHCDGSSSTCHNIGSDIAGTQNDAATANWGSSWRMPSREQFDELKNNCTSVWTTNNGVNGRKFIGPNGGIIFLPATGHAWNSELYDVGSYGNYWSSTSYDEDDAFELHVNSGNAYWYDGDRCRGRSVRPVRNN